jgi:histidine triad (HIT) family protein
MSSVFTKIAAREIPAYIIAEDDFFIAILDINPLVKGHVLVFPKKEEDYIFDLENNELESMIVFAKKVANQLKKTIPCRRIGLSVIGLEVPHAHIHLIPINSIDDMNFSKTKLSFSPSEMTALQNLILSVS